MPQFTTHTLHVYAYRNRGGRSELLVLRRSAPGRLAGTWHPVEGQVNEPESPAQAAVRELREQTSLPALELHGLDTVLVSHVPHADEVRMTLVYAARVPEEGVVLLTDEHDDYTWLGVDAAADKLCWPNARRAVREIAEHILRDSPLRALMRADPE